MTIFNYDKDLLTKWLLHHSQIGVEKFYLYWNGELTKETERRLKSYVPKKLINNVIFFGFDIPYIEDGMKGSNHLGQTAGISDFLWWAKDFSEFVLFSDLDEFLYLHENIKLETYDSFLFKHRFCMTVPPSVLYKDLDPSHILAEKNEHESRYKSIHRTSKILIPGVHCENKVCEGHKGTTVGYDKAELCHIVSFIERERDGMKFLNLNDEDFVRPINLNNSKKFLF